MTDFYCVLGIILNTIGTLFTLWTIFVTKKGEVGTAWEHDNRPKQFPKEKRRVIIGFICIVIGNALQIAGFFL